MIVTSFELSDVEVVFPNDATAILTYRVKQEVAPQGRQCEHRAGDERYVDLDSERRSLAMRHAGRRNADRALALPGAWPERRTLKPDEPE